jgi:two-component sensor histidine kinase
LSAAVSDDETVYLGTLNHGLIATNLTDIRAGRPMNFAPFERTNGLSVYSIEGPIDNALWIGTNDGLYTANLKTMELQRFGKLKGLINLNFNHGASMLASDRTVFFGGPYGYSRSTIKDSVVSHSANVEIWLTSIYLDQKRYESIRARDAGVNLYLQSSNRNLQFQFTVNDHRFPGLNSYEYKLDGYDHDWQSTGRSNSASYTSLPPGEYVFRARGADAEGVWSENEITIPVFVAVPTWRSWWALALYAVLVVATLLLLRRWHEQRVAQRTRLQLAEESAAAYARLEDDYQGQQEVTDFLLRSKTPAALALLGAVQELISARGIYGGELETSSNEITGDMLQTLRTVQELTSRTLSAETTDMHALTDEICARLAHSSQGSADTIIVNDVTATPIPLSHALLLSLILHELLTLATATTADDDVSPVVRIAMEPAQYDNNNQLCYRISIEDSGQPATDDTRFGSHLAVSFHLVEGYGGYIEQRYDRGNRVVVTLSLPEDTRKLD